MGISAGAANLKPPSVKPGAKGVVLESKPDDSTQDSLLSPATSGRRVAGHTPVATAAIRDAQHDELLQLGVDQSGRAGFTIWEGKHQKFVPVESKQGQHLIRQSLRGKGKTASRGAVKEMTEELLSVAEDSGIQLSAYGRVAPFDSGLEIYLADEAFTRFRVLPNNVEEVKESSDTLFNPSPNALPLPYPAEKGCVAALQEILNVSEQDFKLLLGWITYTFAHPKVEGNKYVFLVLVGDQGTGKSFISNLLLKLIDPSKLGIQALPTRGQDLAIVLQGQQVVAFDNMRSFSATTSDLLCMASTGGVVSDRKLYTDSDLSTKMLHGAVIFNGIYKFVAQSDLAQRCLTIRLNSIAQNSIRSERELLATFEQHRAEIFRYMLDTIAKIFHYLPDVEIVKPERMVDFCRWLAAFEQAEGLEKGVLQNAYSDNVNSAQLDTLMDNTLAAALIAFCEREGAGKWEGTPTELYQELCGMVSQRTTYGRDWPQNPIALGRRLVGLKASLMAQGVHLDMSRGRSRRVRLHIDPAKFGVSGDEY